MGTNTYQRVAVKVDNLTVMGLDQLRAILRRNEQMFGKLGEMFLESGRSYNPQYTVVYMKDLVPIFKMEIFIFVVMASVRSNFP